MQHLICPYLTKGDGGQVNCCFQSCFFSLRKTTKSQIIVFSQEDLPWSLPSACGQLRGKRSLQSFSFYTVVNKRNAFNNNLHWQAICRPFCPASVQPVGRTAVMTPRNANLGFDTFSDRWNSRFFFFLHDIWRNILILSYSGFTSTHTMPESTNIAQKLNK